MSNLLPAYKTFIKRHANPMQYSSKFHKKVNQKTSERTLLFRIIGHECIRNAPPKKKKLGIYIDLITIVLFQKITEIIRIFADHNNGLMAMNFIID